jgi:hypothetical protein
MIHQLACTALQQWEVFLFVLREQARRAELFEDFSFHK